MQLGDLAQATTHYKLALEAYRELGEPFGEAHTLNWLGDTLAAQGDAPAARAAWASSEAILDRLAHPLAETVQAKLAQSAPAPSAKESQAADHDRLAPIFIKRIGPQSGQSYW